MPVNEPAVFPKLDPELAQYLEPMAHFGQMLRHPLVYSVPYFGEAENERLNRLLEYRKADLREAQEKGQHARWISIHERPYRLQALMELKGEIPERDFLPLVLEVYVDTESARQNFDEWEEILRDLTGTDPWGTFHELPDSPFIVYRGGVKRGFSWTRDLKVAQWFSTRLGGSGEIWQAVVTKDDIIGYYDGRNEKEVIAAYGVVEHLIEPYEG